MTARHVWKGLVALGICILVGTGGDHAVLEQRRNLAVGEPGLGQELPGVTAQRGRRA